MQVRASPLGHGVWNVMSTEMKILFLYWKLFKNEYGQWSVLSANFISAFTSQKVFRAKILFKNKIVLLILF